jgi:hypothetical protein
MMPIEKVDLDPWSDAMDGGPNTRWTAQMVVRALVGPNTARVMAWSVNEAVHGVLCSVVYDAVQDAVARKVTT